MRTRIITAAVALVFAAPAAAQPFTEYGTACAWAWDDEQAAAADLHQVRQCVRSLAWWQEVQDLERTALQQADRRLAKAIRLHMSTTLKMSITLACDHDEACIAELREELRPEYGSLLD